VLARTRQPFPLVYLHLLLSGHFAHTVPMQKRPPQVEATWIFDFWTHLVKKHLHLDAYIEALDIAIPSIGR
jgi:hypothetical protein